jgi:hypothetical protein
LLFIIEADFTDIDARHDVPFFSWFDCRARDQRSGSAKQ